MRKLLVVAAVALLAQPTQPAQAQPRPPRGRLFISPFGEPFRGPDGLSAWFAQADADHDGAITAAEFQADAAHAFSLYDSNGDGVIDGLEIQAYERERAPEITELALAEEARGDRRGRRGRRREGGGQADDPAASAPFRGAGSTGAARFSLLDEPEPLLAADEDVDGKVTRAEWTRAAARRFARLDRGHAGRLTLASLRNTAAKRPIFSAGGKRSRNDSLK